jgi:hypothetical protein
VLVYAHRTDDGSVDEDLRTTFRITRYAAIQLLYASLRKIKNKLCECTYVHYIGSATPSISSSCCQDLLHTELLA